MGLVAFKRWKAGCASCGAHTQGGDSPSCMRGLVTMHFIDSSQACLALAPGIYLMVPCSVAEGCTIGARATSPQGSGASSRCTFRPVAQRKPANSRATATQALFICTPRSRNGANRCVSLNCSFHAVVRIDSGGASWRASASRPIRRVEPLELDTAAPAAI